MTATVSLLKAVTGNRLADGEVVFWGEGGWRERFPDASLFADPADADAALDAAKADPTVIVDPYIIDVRLDGEFPVPTSFRERVRALGPTTHLDMGKQAEGGPILEAIAAASGAARSAGRSNLIKKR